MTQAAVARFNVTPVKSTRLQHPDRIRLERYGAVGNRDFFFLDQDGRRLSGERKGPLLAIVSEYDRASDRLALRMPDGIVAEGPAAATGEAVTVDFYGRAVPGRIVEGDFEEALSRYVGREVRLARVDLPGDATDVRPVTIVSLASVAELSRQGGRDEMVDPGRFRMTIELDGCEPHEEDAWAGRRVRLGEAVVSIGRQVPRCVVTTLDPETGVRDFPTLSVIKRYRTPTEEGQLPFGVYADVVEPGAAQVGDAVKLVD
jgi:uncharacterized protein YcbX